MQLDMASPSLAVVVGTRNRLCQLQASLEALIGKIDVRHEIVVVELGSTDGTLEYLQGLAGIRLVTGGEPAGQGRNLNGVFKTLAAKYVCWLSDDNVVVEGMLDLAVSILEKNPDIGMVALKVKDLLGRSQSKHYIGAISPTGVLNCNQGVIRGQLFRQVGFFDERYGTYGIDPDLTMKVLLEGYKIVHTKRIAIYHYRDHNASPGAVKNEERTRQKQTSRALYRQKYGHWIVRRTRWQSMLYVVIRLYIVSPIYRLTRRLGASLETWLGYDERDWANMLYARYVSKLDLLVNRRKPFYLVQRMPARTRHHRLD